MVVLVGRQGEQRKQAGLCTALHVQCLTQHWVPVSRSSSSKKGKPTLQQQPQGHLQQQDPPLQQQRNKQRQLLHVLPLPSQES